MIKDLQGIRKQRDEEDVARITTWHDPFADHDNDKLLINVSSGCVATESITSDLLNAYL